MIVQDQFQMSVTSVKEYCASSFTRAGVSPSYSKASVWSVSDLMAAGLSGAIALQSVFLDRLYEHVQRGCGELMPGFS